MNNVVHLVLASAKYDLYLPMLTKMQIENWRKMCKLMRKYSWINTQAMASLKNWLLSETDRTKKDWHEASAKYMNEYELPAGHKLAPEYTPEQARKIASKNKKLIDTVKQTKKTHERTKKFFDIFKEETE